MKRVTPKIELMTHLTDLLESFQKDSEQSDVWGRNNVKVNEMKRSEMPRKIEC